MLSKEEFERAFDILKEQHDYLSSNMHYNYPFSIEMLENVQDCFDNLIKEHFELVEKNKLLDKLNDEQACAIRESFFKQIPCTPMALHEPQPYKFEDLKYGLWVWDEKNKMCLRICKTKEKENIKDLIVVGGNQYWIENFEENRFFPVQMANVRCE